MISKLKNYFLLFSVAMIVYVPLVSWAQDVKIKNPLGEGDDKANLLLFIKKILEFAIKIGIPIIALAVIYSGFLFVAARGNSRELETAKKSIMYTLLGAAILLGSWAIAELIADTVLSL